MSKEKAKIIKNKKKFNASSVMKFVRTLWRNDAVVEVATTTKWYWSIIVFVFALIISVLPATINQAMAQGRNFVSSSNISYSDPYYVGLYAYYTDDKAPEITLDSETNTLATTTVTSGFYEDYTLSDTITKAYKPVYSFARTVTNSGITSTQNYLDIYVVNINDGTTDLSTIVNNIANTNTNYADGYTNDKDVQWTRTTPYILFTTDGFYAVNYSANGSTSLSGNYAHISDSFTFETNQYTFKDVLGYNIDFTSNILSDQEKVFNNFLSWCDCVYIDVRFQSVWVTFGIYCGVNGSIMILMGIIIWLMTRGKNNPNNKTKIWEAYSMGFWASGSPAILSLLGFLIPSFGMMLFIMLYAFRIMFLSMKQLRPVYNN